MNKAIEEIFHANLENLIKAHGFKVLTEMGDDESYMIEYSSGDFILKIQNYFREIYATLYKVNHSKDETALFNLLEYLIEDEAPHEKYFHEEKDLAEAYRKQLLHISTVIIEYYNLISSFFNVNYELNIIEFEKYWKLKHPELYK